MSALFTALVEGETKETLAWSLIEHRAALRRVEHALKQIIDEVVEGERLGTVSGGTTRRIIDHAATARARANVALSFLTLEEAAPKDWSVKWPG